MTRAVKAVSTYRGRDPRDFVLCGFGGNGPVVAAAIARALQMRRVLVPPAPGVFSAARPALSRDRARVRADAVLRSRRRVASRGARTPATASSRPRPSARCAEGVRAEAVVARPLRRPALRRAGVRADDARRRRRLRPTSAGSRPTSSPSTSAPTGTPRGRDPIDIVNLRLTARVARADGDAPTTRAPDSVAARASVGARAPTSGRSTGSLDDAGDLARGAARLAAAAGPADRRGVRRDLRRPAGLPRDARRAREHRHRPLLTRMTASRSTRHARGGQERARVDRRRDGARRHAQRLLARRPRHDGLLDRALRPRRRARRAGADARGAARVVPDGDAPRPRATTATTSQPGDVFISNDPYGFGGQHLPDIYVIKPIFHDGELEGYAGDDGAPRRRRRHHARQRSPCTRPRSSRRGCACRCSSSTRPAARTTSAASASSRRTRASRSQVIGDLRAQVAACRAGERGLTRDPRAVRTLETPRAISTSCSCSSERLMRAELAALPDGVYAFEDFIDGVRRRAGAAARSRVELTVRGDEVSVDFDGDGAAGGGGHQLPGRAWSTPASTARSAASRAARSRTRGLHAADPHHRAGGHDRESGAARACGARGVIGYRVYDAVMGALAQVVPEKVSRRGRAARR